MTTPPPSLPVRVDTLADVSFLKTMGWELFRTATAIQYLPSSRDPAAPLSPGSASPRPRIVLSVIEGPLRSWDWTFVLEEGGVVLDPASPPRRHDITMFSVGAPIEAPSPSALRLAYDLRAAATDVDPWRDVRALLYRPRVVAPSEQWEVYPRLFIGRSPEPGEHIDVDILVRLAEPFAPGVSANGSVVDHPLDDAEDAEVVDKAFQVVRALVPELAAAWREGKTIRIGCLAGLNRSGLVVAALLTEIAGMTGHEAVAHLRWKRGSMALCNARFHEVLCETWAPSA